MNKKDNGDIEKEKIDHRYKEYSAQGMCSSWLIYGGTVLMAGVFFILVVVPFYRGVTTLQEQYLFSSVSPFTQEFASTVGRVAVKAEVLLESPFVALLLDSAVRERFVAEIGTVLQSRSCSPPGWDANDPQMAAQLLRQDGLRSVYHLSSCVYNLMYRILKCSWY